MNKYDEIMEHIHVTDEMHNRVLSGVDKYFVNEYKRRKRRSIYTFGAAAAAVAVIAVSGVSLHQYSLDKKQDIVVGGSMEETELAGTAGVFYVMDYETKEELENTVGFELPELTRLPFALGSTAYTAIGDKLAQIIYYGEAADTELIFRKAPGTDDISGDYNVYDESRELTVDGIKISVKGNNGLIYLASWTDGEYAYSISVSQGCKEEAMETILAEVIG